MRYGNFEYQVMLLRPFNAPTSFYDYINKILMEKLDIFIILYLDDILIDIRKASQGYMKAILQVLKEVQKYNLFANLKKYYFHEKEFYFLGYNISSQEICIEKKIINVINTWLEPKSIQNIQVFIGFANLYQHFIQDFSKIATLFTSILKINFLPTSTLLFTSIDNSKLIGNNSKNNRKLVKSNFIKAIRRAKKFSFLTFNTWYVFIQLRQAFTKAPILQHFDPEYHI